MAEQTEMDRLVREMMEHICDELCRHPRQATDPEQLEDICAECRMGKLVCGILNAYNREAMKQRWIPVEERLPDPGSEVLAYIKHNYVEDGWRAYRVYEHTDHWVGMGNLCEVIAWMPLPEPYRPEVLQDAGADAGEYGDAPTLRPAT